MDTGITGEVYLSTKSGIYTTRINDSEEEYVDFSKGDIVKVTGTIADVSDFIGITVSLDPASVDLVE